MLDKSLVKARRPYEDRLEIITLCGRLKSFYDKYKGTCQNIVAGGEVVWLDNPEYQRTLVWTLKQKQDYITNLFNGMAEIRPTILLYYEDKKDIYEVLDGKQRLTTLFQFIDNEFAKDKASLSTLAMLLDGKWYEQGKMGWFGMSDTTSDSLKEYTKFFNKTLEELKETHPHATVTLVDCHI